MQFNPPEAAVIRDLLNLTPFSSSLNLQLITAVVIDQTQDFVSGSWRRSGARPSFRQTSEHSAAAIAKQWQRGIAFSQSDIDGKLQPADLHCGRLRGADPRTPFTLTRETARMLITPDYLAAGFDSASIWKGVDKNKFCAAYNYGESLREELKVHISCSWP